MDTLVATYTNTGALHHAYIIEGDHETVRTALLSFLEEHLKESTKANPDFSHSIFDTFTIDDARKLREAQANKAIAGGRKLFVIETRSFTVEAQNSLLKIFEEPTPSTHFFILMPSTEVLLPTLRSRVVLVSHTADELKHVEAKEFLQASIQARLKMAAEIAEEKDKSRAIALIDGIIKLMHDPKKDKPHVALKELLHVRMYLNDRSPSLKLLLEHIAIVI